MRHQGVPAQFVLGTKDVPFDSDPTQEEDLRQQQEWFQGVLASIGDAVIAADTEGAVLFLNEAAQRLTGWSMGEAKGRSVEEVFPLFQEPVGAPAVNPALQLLREGIFAGVPNSALLRARNDRHIPIAPSANPIRDALGKMLGVLLVFRDLSENRKNALALSESEARSMAIIQTSLDAVLLMNSDGRITGWNAAAERIFGWSEAEVLQSDLASRIIPERLREAHHRGLAHLKATGEGPVLGRRIELPALRRDGTEFPIELSIIPLPQSENAVFVGFVRDISQRKAAETELAERARLSNLRADIGALLASSVETTFGLSQCCHLLVGHLDAAFARIWTVDPSEPVLILRASAGLYTHLDGPHGRVPIGSFKIGRIARDRRALLTNDVAHDPNISDPEWARREGMQAFAGYPLIAGDRLWGVMGLFSRQMLTNAVLGDLAPIADAIAGKLEHQAGQEALIAEKERAELASRAKDSFLAALSHELRTPLTPVLMTATALHLDPRLPADIRAELGMMKRNITLEARLIDDLLDLTAISKGKLQLREELCDVHSLIGLAVEIVRDEAQSKPVRLHLELAARRTGFVGDPARLQQVFWNLLRNSIKFTPADGAVSIRTRDETGGRLVVEVSDTGIGLEPDALEAVFHPFEQAGRENDHRYGGLGLGLAIAKAIVDMHGGLIFAKSGGLGKGAAFVIELPRAHERPSGATLTLENLSTRKHGLIGALNLLVVEDHESTLLVMRRLLGRAGHSVVSAGSISAALVAAEAGNFDVVISDLGLPDGTGLDLFSKLRAVHPQIRGIALSGYGMDEDLRRSIEAGFCVHLIKPVNMEQLLGALALAVK